MIATLGPILLLAIIAIFVIVVCICKHPHCAALSEGRH